MPFVANPVDGVRIYYESIGAGPSLVLAHGFTMSTTDWHELGYVNAFKNDYQMVLIDSRGHGQSDGPHDGESHGITRKVGDTLAVLDELGIERAHFLGFSMGGWLGFGMLGYAPERLLTMMIGGMQPHKPDPNPLNQRIAALGEGMESYTAEREQATGWRQPKPRRIRYLGQDAKALIASTLGTRDDPGLDDGLERVTTPCLLWAGTEDPRLDGVKRTAALMPDAEFHALDGIDHAGAVVQLELVQPLVTDFLSRHAAD